MFPTPSGDGIARHNNVMRAFKAAVRAAGLTDAKGKLKYTGVHALRHFYASWCINPPERGGQGLPPKVVQQLLGHSSIVMTMDTYGHLFPADDDAHKRLGRGRACAAELNSDKNATSARSGRDINATCGHACGRSAAAKSLIHWLGRQDSNLGMAESKSAALPLGYAPSRRRIAGGPRAPSAGAP